MISLDGGRHADDPYLIAWSQGHSPQGGVDLRLAYLRKTRTQLFTPLPLQFLHWQCPAYFRHCSGTLFLQFLWERGPRHVGQEAFWVVVREVRDDAPRVGQCSQPHGGSHGHRRVSARPVTELPEGFEMLPLHRVLSVIRSEIVIVHAPQVQQEAPHDFSLLPG